MKIRAYKRLLLLVTVLLVVFLPSGVFAEDGNGTVSESINNADSIEEQEGSVVKSIDELRQQSNENDFSVDGLYEKAKEASNNLWLAALILSGIILIFKPRIAIGLFLTSTAGWAVINYYDTVMAFFVSLIDWITGS